MESQRWRAVRAVFDEVVELAPGARADRLAALAAADPELRRAVETLLQADAAAEEGLAGLMFGLPAPADPLGLAGRTLSHTATARDRYGFVAEAWRHADPELQPYVLEAGAAARRCSRPPASSQLRDLPPSWSVPFTAKGRPAMTPHITAPAAPDRKPRDDEMDIFGITHPGKVRTDNQDHFLVCALRKEAVIQLTSLPDTSTLTAGSERVALLMMVADGVGGGSKGATASRIALEAVTRYVSRCMACYYAAGSAEDREFIGALQEGALQCHAQLLRRGEEDPEYRGMATTLTLYLGHWPRGYLLQVGDSRCYLLRGDELSQITRDQTMAQELIDLGVMTRADAAGTRFEHTLSSSIGGRQTAPVATRFDLTWDTVVLLCSDGLTRHVPDDRIRDRLRAMTSSRQVCQDLLQDALDGGGSDNVTILVRRAVPREH